MLLTNTNISPISFLATGELGVPHERKRAKYFDNFMFYYSTKRDSHTKCGPCYNRANAGNSSLREPKQRRTRESFSPENTGPFQIHRIVGTRNGTRTIPLARVSEVSRDGCGGSAALLALLRSARLNRPPPRCAVGPMRRNRASLGFLSLFITPVPSTLLSRGSGCVSHVGGDKLSRVRAHQR